jgi:hypothetical protein
MLVGQTLLCVCARACVMYRMFLISFQLLIHILNVDLCMHVKDCYAVAYADM